MDQNLEKQLAGELDKILSNTLSKRHFHEENVNRRLAAYLLYKAAMKKEVSHAYQDIINGNLQCCENAVYLCKESFDEKVWESITPLLLKYPAETFAQVVLTEEFESYSRDSSISPTPPSLIKLSLALLKPSPDDVIADLCCGTGSFMAEVAKAVPGARIHAYDIQTSAVAIAAMKADILRGITVSIKDIFTLVSDEGESEIKGFDKIFMDAPMGIRLTRNEYCERLIRENPEISRVVSSEWIFALLACDLTSSGGKAITLIPAGLASISRNRSIRKYFIEKGLIECVISLPVNMSANTAIAFSMLVLSHGNKSVRMIDAREICHKKRRFNEFTDEDIDKICLAINTDTEYGISVSNTEIAENDYSLSPQRYIIKENYTFENGVLFGDIMKNVGRGIQIQSKDLDSLVTKTDTGMQYLELKNIQDGMISENLPYIKAIDPKHEKYCLKTNDLILSRTTLPLKIAVAEVEEGHQILASGNMIIIELDESRANPYYIQVFLESEIGKAILKSITVGTPLAVIGVDDLRKISIPLPSMEEQERIATKYLATRDEVKLLRYRLERALAKLQNVMEEAE